MWSLHHISVIVAISGEFSVSISDSSVIYGMTDLMFLFMTTGMSHFLHGTCILLLPREGNGGLVTVFRREVVMTGIFHRLWAPARSGGTVECHPCITCSSPGTMVQTGIDAWV